MLTPTQMVYLVTKVIPELVKVTDCMDNMIESNRKEYGFVLERACKMFDNQTILSATRFYWRVTQEWREACPEDLEKLFNLIAKHSVLSKWKHIYLKGVAEEYGSSYENLCKMAKIEPLPEKKLREKVILIPFVCH